MKDKVSISLEASYFLKGVAIILVLIVHTLSSFEQSIFVGYDGRFQTLAVFIDKI